MLHEIKSEDKSLLASVLWGWHRLNNNVHFEAPPAVPFGELGEVGIWVEGVTVWLQLCFASQTLMPAGQQQLGGLSHDRIWFQQQQGVKKWSSGRRTEGEWGGGSVGRNPFLALRVVLLKIKKSGYQLIQETNTQCFADSRPISLSLF